MKISQHASKTNIIKTLIKPNTEKLKTEKKAFSKNHMTNRDHCKISDLFVGELGRVRKDKIDSELRRQGRRSRWPRLHEGKRGLGWFQIRDRTSPGFNKGVISSRGRRDVGGERPEFDGSREEAGSEVAKHFSKTMGFARLASRREVKGNGEVRETLCFQSFCLFGVHPLLFVLLVSGDIHGTKQGKNSKNYSITHSTF